LQLAPYFVKTYNWTGPNLNNFEKYTFLDKELVIPYFFRWYL
jgi:hypothetical protein